MCSKVKRNNRANPQMFRNILICNGNNKYNESYSEIRHQNHAKMSVRISAKIIKP